MNIKQFRKILNYEQCSLVIKVKYYSSPSKSSSSSSFIYTTQVQKKEIIQETIKTKMVEIIQLKCTLFKSVCNNQSSKAFELAAA